MKTPIPVLGLRLEVRDFLTGLPDANLTSTVSHHNPFAGGGLVLRFLIAVISKLQNLTPRMLYSMQF
ncbi:MAG TPA: hypothetical protein VF493_10265 [Terriglobales bacterium]